MCTCLQSPVVVVGVVVIWIPHTRVGGTGVDQCCYCPGVFTDNNVYNQYFSHSLTKLRGTTLHLLSSGVLYNNYVAHTSVNWTLTASKGIDCSYMGLLLP